MKRAGRFFREQLAGLRSDEFRRLFAREAPRAYAVLSRDLPRESEPAGAVKRWWHRFKVVFKGLSAKLTPARRTLFVVSLVAVVLGMIRFQVDAASGSFSVDLFSIFLPVGVCGLVFLLALELADRVLVRDELEVARELQRDLLPRAAPELSGWRFAHSYRTANEVGGDYYDFVALPDGRLALLAGDASGHGMAAGLVMAIANAAIKLALDLDPAPPRVAELLNRALWRTGTRRNFMSLFYGALEPESGRLDYVCAGHPFPLLRRSGGEIVELGHGSFPLGLRESAELASQVERIEPGDLLVVFSDGLFETRNENGEPFGYERITAKVAGGGSAAEVHRRLLAALDLFRGDEPLVDDVSIVVVERAL